jgi:hypothetical protein
VNSLAVHTGTVSPSLRAVARCNTNLEGVDRVQRVPWCADARGEQGVLCRLPGSCRGLARQHQQWCQLPQGRAVRCCSDHGGACVGRVFGRRHSLERQRRPAAARDPPKSLQLLNRHLRVAVRVR